MRENIYWIEILSRVETERKNCVFVSTMLTVVIDLREESTAVVA